MHGFSARTAKAAGPGRGSGNQGIGFPRIYDLLILALTRGRERQYRRAVLELAELAPGHRVLDVGCGTGSQAIMASRQVGSGGSVTGVDISEPMLAVARRKTRRAGVDVEFHKADAVELPFADGGFDVVMVTTVLHMVPNDRRRDSLREASRVLCWGGRLVLIDYAGDLSGRSHLSARHGRHGQFDLNGLWGMLVEEESPRWRGPLGWLSLHYLRAMKI